MRPGSSSPATYLLIAGSLGFPLIRMDPDYYYRFNMIFFVLSIFPMLVMISATRENAAGGREQTDNAN